jgi:hypothetical protein
VKWSMTVSESEFFGVRIGVKTAFEAIPKSEKNMLE